MKKILLTLLLAILTNPIFGQEFKPDKWCSRLLTEDVVRFAFKNFPPPPHIQPVIFLRSAPLYPKYIATAEILDNGQYLINVNMLYLDIDMDLDRVLIHELQHILQFHQGRLKTLDSGFYWEGQIYSFDWPYDERPWEIEADQASDQYCN